MPVTTRTRPRSVTSRPFLNKAHSCLWTLLDIRLSRVHPEAIDARYVHTVKVLLTKQTLGYSPEAECDQLVLSLTLRQDPTPIRPRIEAYVAEEFPCWTLRNWWTTADLFDEEEPF